VKIVRRQGVQLMRDDPTVPMEAFSMDPMKELPDFPQVAIGFALKSNQTVRPSQPNLLAAFHCPLLVCLPAEVRRSAQKLLQTADLGVKEMSVVFLVARTRCLGEPLPAAMALALLAGLLLAPPAPISVAAVSAVCMTVWSQFMA
jgi:hypothetical protein